MNRYIYIFKHTFSHFQYTLKLAHMTPNIQTNLNTVELHYSNIKMECSVFDVVSSAEGRCYVIVRRMEDYVRGTQLASRTTQTLLEASLSFSPSSSALAFSLSLSALPSLFYVQNEEIKHPLSSYVSRC